MTFHVFSKDPCRRLVSPLSTFQRTCIYYNCSRNIFWVDFKSLNPKSFLFLPPYLLFLKLVALRPIFHAYVASVYGSRGELKKGVCPTLFGEGAFFPVSTLLYIFSIARSIYSLNPPSQGTSSSLYIWDEKIGNGEGVRSVKGLGKHKEKHVQGMAPKAITLTYPCPTIYANLLEENKR